MQTPGSLLSSRCNESSSTVHGRREFAGSTSTSQLFWVLLHVNVATRQGLLGSMASMLCAEALGNELEVT